MSREEDALADVLGAVAYARDASSHPDNEQRSIQTQLEACRQMADRLGADLLHEFVDLASSGTSIDRPALTRLFDQRNWSGALG
jgi:DNA invertase Pin-like site-specific DNA recombinase